MDSEREDSVKERRIDAKWRLNIPPPLNRKFSAGVVFGLNKEGCIQMKPVKKCFDGLSGNLFIRMPKGGKLTIPPLLRNSTSFFYGRRVMMVKRGDKYELWPWPE